jgi:hypothetical protein
MDNVQAAKAPVHLWIVGIVSLIWHAWACVDYIMTRLRSTEWLSQGGADPQVMLAWIDSFPIYAQFGWGLGVWMGLLGSGLLLMRHRWAVPAYALSLLGAVIGLGYQIVASPAPAPMNEGIFAMLPYVIIVAAAAFFYYAHSQRKSGVLR